eukprot:gene788-biopygen13320
MRFVEVEVERGQRRGGERAGGGPDDGDDEPRAVAHGLVAAQDVDVHERVRGGQLRPDDRRAEGVRDGAAEVPVSVGRHHRGVVEDHPRARQRVLRLREVDADRTSRRELVAAGARLDPQRARRVIDAAQHPARRQLAGRDARVTHARVRRRARGGAYRRRHAALVELDHRPRAPAERDRRRDVRVADIDPERVRHDGGRRPGVRHGAEADAAAEQPVPGRALRAVLQREGRRPGVEELHQTVRRPAVRVRRPGRAHPDDVLDEELRGLALKLAVGGLRLHRVVPVRHDDTGGRRDADDVVDRRRRVVRVGQHGRVAVVKERARPQRLVGGLGGGAELHEVLGGVVHEVRRHRQLRGLPRGAVGVAPAR